MDQHAPTTPNIQNIDELVINWHLTESCNFRCQYCFAKWDKPIQKSELWRDVDKTHLLLHSLYDFFKPENLNTPLRQHIQWRSLRLSVVGGEPTLIRNRLPEIISQTRNLGFRNSLISNGSQPEIILALAKDIDVLGISIDSVDHVRNKKIGRIGRNGISLTQNEIKNLIIDMKSSNPALTIKINTVVNNENADEDFTNFISDISPDRWKIMRALPVVTDRLSINETVRRHIKWNIHGPDLREALAHLVAHIKRHICGIASAGSPSFSV